MKYQGSKTRIKKNILPIIQNIINENNIKTYIEPFCGGCNVIDGIKCKHRLATDISAPLIGLLKYMQNEGKLFDEVTKEFYDDVRANKNNNKYPEWIKGCVGYLASYNGRYFDGGYAKTITSKTGVTRNYYDEAKRNIEKQFKENYMKDILFHCTDYKEFKDFKNSLIYCDIPYKNTKQYGVSSNFNHNEFWSWVEEASKNNIIIVSEQQAPEGIECIWKNEVLRTIDNTKRVVATEKLYLIDNRKNGRG